MSSFRTSTRVLEVLDVNSLRAFGGHGKVTGLKLLFVFAGSKFQLHKLRIKILVALDSATALLTLAHGALLLVALRVDHDLNFLRRTFPFTLFGIYIK